MRTSTRKRHYLAFLRHSHLLRTAMWLAAYRIDKLDEALSVPGSPGTVDELARMEQSAVEDLGAIRASVLLSEVRRIVGFHVIPLQIALCLLDAVLTKYRDVSAEGVLQDDDLDAYLLRRSRFVGSLKPLRDSLLHARLDNTHKHTGFLESVRQEDGSSLFLLLEEGATALEKALVGWRRSLRKEKGTPRP